jgi:hypothetical protein
MNEIFFKNNILLQDERRRWMRYTVRRIFDLHTSKARYYELKVVLLHLRRVNVKTIGGFI